MNDHVEIYYFSWTNEKEKKKDRERERMLAN